MYEGVGSTLCEVTPVHSAAEEGNWPPRAPGGCAGDTLLGRCACFQPLPACSGQIVSFARLVPPKDGKG